MEGEEAAGRELRWGGLPLSCGHEEEGGRAGSEEPPAWGRGSVGAAGETCYSQPRMYGMSNDGPWK